MSDGSLQQTHSLDRLGGRGLGGWGVGGGGMRHDSAEILFQTVLREAIISSSDIGRDVHSLMWSIQRFFCRPGRRPSSEVHCRMVLEKLSWHMTCPKHVSFRLLTAATRGSRGHSGISILILTHWRWLIDWWLSRCPVVSQYFRQGAVGCSHRKTTDLNVPSTAETLLIKAKG